MKSTRYSRLPIFLLTLVLLTAAHPRAFAAKTTVIPEARMPDVLVWIDARTPGKSWVSITYPGVVTRQTAETHLASLLSNTGWTTGNPTISSGSVMQTGEHPMTSVEFATPATAQFETGYLPVEPIAKAFKGFDNVEIQYIVPPTFQFRGVGDFENKYVRIRLTRGDNTYRYSIHLKSRDFESLDIPGPRVPGNDEDSTSGRLELIVKVLVVALALTVAVLGFIISARLVQRHRRSGE